MIDKLHYISQASASGSHLEAIEQVLKAGGKWVQLRVKDQTEDAILELAIATNALCKQYSARLIVNDHPHIAAEAGAYGVHLGLSDMPIRQARAIVGDQMIIGGTANTFEHILHRVAEGADYIGLGPYRFTKTKKNLSPVIGINGYKVIMDKVQKANISIPVIAIGGVLSGDILALTNLGLHGIAVSGALTCQDETASILSAMNKCLQP